MYVLYLLYLPYLPDGIPCLVVPVILGDYRELRWVQYSVQGTS
jgi:hypothetical protein